MYQKFFLLVFLLGNISIPAYADLRNEAIDDCLLEHLTNAKLDSVAVLITNSCTQNYRTPNFITKKKRAYNQCLLKHLKGVESDYAAKKIVKVCDKKHLHFGY